MKKPDWRVWIKDRKECKNWLKSYLRRGVLRKTGDESRLYLRKANHNLNFANWVFEKHKDEIPKIFRDETFYDWIISIYYYAVYHSALALISKERHSSKSHSASLCFLIYYNYHLQKALDKEDIEIIANSLDKEDIETIGDSKELRERASYDVHELFEKKLAEQAREKAVNFINKIRVLLQESKSTGKKARSKKNKRKAEEEMAKKDESKEEKIVDNKKNAKTESLQKAATGEKSNEAEKPMKEDEPANINEGLEAKNKRENNLNK